MSKYELIERLGTGASAEMFRGRALASSGFEKPIAIKRLLPHLQRDKRYVDWLLAEAKLVSKLRHRNIVQVFDVGLGDDGAYLMVLEYVDGANVATLQKYCEARGERISLDLALHIAAEVAEALAYAHTTPGPDGKPLRVVHRDVSPPNILLSLAGEVKLTDFGFATRPDGGHLAGHRRVAYVSPELVAGDLLDARSDVFSLGVVLFELVTGQRLFSHLSEAAATSALLDGRIPRPRTIDNELPMQLDVLMMRALARNPADRPQTAAQFATLLREARYQLESTAVDPATELARLVTRLEAAKRQMRSTSHSQQADFSSPEASIIHVGPSAFHAGEASDVADVLAARAALDQFEVEETKLARSPLSPSAVTAAVPPPGVEDEATRLVAPQQSFADEATRMIADPAGPLGQAGFGDESTRIVSAHATTGDGATRLALDQRPVDDETTRMVPEMLRSRSASLAGKSVGERPKTGRAVVATHAPAPAAGSTLPASEFGLDDQTVMGGDALVEEISQTLPPAGGASLFQDERTMAVDPSMMDEATESTMAIDPSMFEAHEHTMAIDPSMIEAVPSSASATAPPAPRAGSPLQLAPQELAASQRRSAAQIVGQSPYRVPTYAPAAFAQTQQAPSPLEPPLAPVVRPTSAAAAPGFGGPMPAPDPLAAYVTHMPVATSAARVPASTLARLKALPKLYWFLAAWGVLILIAILVSLF
ncbi:MAG: protein kinase [Myxococcales bacterium]|nr:protein kinase [Myxococcales bacterium]